MRTKKEYENTTWISLALMWLLNIPMWIVDNDQVWWALAICWVVSTVSYVYNFRKWVKLEKIEKAERAAAWRNKDYSTMAQELEDTRP
jgi:hypothetical protein